jgi:hypothetical protein
MAAAAFLLLGSLLLLPLTAHGEAAPSTPAAVPPATGGAPTPSPVGNVDYRYPFTLEAAATVGFFGTFGTYSTSLFAYGGSLTFGGPVSEGRQIIGGVAAATGQAGPSYAWLVEAFAGYRILTFADPWRTRFDAALALDYSRFNTPVIGTAVHAGVGLGVRAAVAVQYFFTPSLGIGPQVDVQVLAITFEAFASLGAVVTFDW